jgi:hypothetical protein
VAFLSSPELRQRSVRLGLNSLAVAYPAALDCWFDGVVEPEGHIVARRKSVRIRPLDEPGRFDVLIGSGIPATELDLGDALATFWERVSFLLIDDLRAAIALHAAALRRDDRFVLIPGGTGSGKTHLALWYRAQGFDLGTDEVVAVSPGTGATNDTLSCSVLTRPVVLKTSLVAAALLRDGEAPFAQQESSCGLILRLAEREAWSQHAIDRGLIVLPQFTAGAPFSLRPLTPGEAGLRLIENCLNARNLPRGGLPLASLIARRLPAVALDYGATEQLAGTLDVFTRQVLAAPADPQDIARLCEAFTAAAAARTPRALAPTSTAAPQVSVVQAAAEPAKRAVPEPTAARFPRRLTVGMATYDDFDGVYFTIQSLRMNHPELEGALEFVVIDNNPGGPCSEALSNFGKAVDGYRYVPRGEWSGTAIRNAVFEEASSPFVVCVDSHVLIAPGALSKLIAFCELQPQSRDLLQGPLIYDDLRNIATHFEPRWRAGMYGTWASDPRGADPLAPCFDIPMHGLGLFACARAAWPGFNPKFRGFGGEEGYIHEKIRQRGGRTLCLPFLRWAHRFNRPLGTGYVNRWEDRMRNYLIGFTELGLETVDMEAHFAELLGAETAQRIYAEIRQDLERAPEPEPAG